MRSPLHAASRQVHTRRVLKVLLSLTVLFIATVVRAQDPTAALFTHIADFWMQSGQRQQIPHPADFKVLVSYSDPEWHILWGFENGIGVFLPLQDKPLNVVPGQLVRLQGLISTDGMDVKQATVLGTPGLPKPVDITHSLMAWNANNLKEITVEAYVDRQEINDTRHTLLSGIVDGHRVAIRVLDTTQSSPPSLEGSFIRAQGLYVWTTDATGQLHHLEIFVTGFGNIHVVRWLSSDPRFDTPVASVDSLNTKPEGTQVHVTGRVVTDAPGENVIIRDGTGQLEVESAQTSPLAPGAEIEAIGTVRGRGPTLRLENAFFRNAGKAAHSALSAQARSLRLRIADDVNELSLADAAKGYIVQLTAVVTWSSPHARFFFAQDASGGIRVDLGAEGLLPPEAGRLVAIDGTTVAGRLTPRIRATSLRSLSDLNLPPATRLTLDQALTGYEEDSLVEIEGYLRAVEPGGTDVTADLSTPAGNFTAHLRAGTDLSRALRSVVLVRGVCTRVADRRGRPSGVVLWVNSAEDITVESAYPSNPDAVPRHTIAELNRFSGRARTRWVRTDGVVTLQEPGRYLYLQDGNESLKALDRATAPLAPGSRVELMGLQGQEGGRFVLREATVLRDQPGSDLPATPIEPAAKPADSLDGRLVRIQGTLVDESPRQGHLVYVLQSGSNFVECHLPLSAAPGDTPRPALRSVVAATGVYRLQYDEYQRPSGFDVSLRSPSDLQVLRAPPWLTPERAVGVTSALLLALALGLLWVTVLRRKVAAQTTVIRAQLEKEGRLMAEIERSSRLESLGMLAGGIAHDFNNLLTIIIGNLTLTRMEDGVVEKAGPFLDEANKGAQRARLLAQKLLTFARGGSPIRRAEDLSDVVREAAAAATGESATIKLSYDFDEELWKAFVDRAQTVQALHNIASYALGSLPPGGTLAFRAWNASLAENEVGTLKAGAYVHLVVEDSGAGLDPTELRHLFDPYSGLDAGRQGLDLAVVRSIVKRHEGHIEVESTKGAGTRFHLWLPARTDSTEPAASAAPCEPPRPAAPKAVRGRVLFMDDEESIRKLAAATLTRLGCEFHVASDGAEAIEAYQAARAKGAPFDLVVLDLTVPGGMGGRETIRHLLELDPHVNAIVSSGYSSDPVLSDYKLHGFAAFVPKPYSVDELEACLRRALRDRQPA